MIKSYRAVAIAAAACLAAGGCTSTGGGFQQGSQLGSPQNGCRFDYAKSAALGVGIGVLAGLLLGGRNAKGAAAAIGGLAGGAVAMATTSYLEHRCQALAAAQAEMKATRITTVAVSVPASGAATADDGVQVLARNDSMFPENSATLSESGLHDMKLLATAYAGTDRKVLIVGHTDSTGTPETNLRLSEQRARNVAELFAADGIDKHQIYYKGAGETRPIDTNVTPEGRSRNRRVEILEMRSEDGILALDSQADSDPDVLLRTAARRSDTASMPRESVKPTRTAAAQASKPPPASVAQSSVRAFRTDSRFDFGGSPVDSTGAPLEKYTGNSGDSKTASNSFSFISQAFASEPKQMELLDTACVSDTFLKAGAVRSLATGDIVTSKVREHAKGLFGTSWSDTLNGNLVGLAQVSVVRDTGAVDMSPKMLVYEHFIAGKKPSLSASGNARAYVGSRGVLYRVFYDAKAWPVRCMDIVFSSDRIAQAPYGQIYYEKGGVVYGARFAPKPVQTNDPSKAS